MLRDGLHARAHGHDHFEPVRELESVPGEEAGDRVAVIGPMVLRLAQAIDHDNARRERLCTWHRGQVI